MKQEVVHHKVVWQKDELRKVEHQWAERRMVAHRKVELEVDMDTHGLVVNVVAVVPVQMEVQSEWWRHLPPFHWFVVALQM